MWKFPQRVTLQWHSKNTFSQRGEFSVNMKQLTTIFIATLLLAVAPAQAGKPPASSTTSTTITFIELNDLHAHLVPHKDVVNDGNGGTTIAMRGGLTNPRQGR